jgi:AcrR family transcriptional regulator
MAYRRTENVLRRLSARHDAIVEAARDTAMAGGMAAIQIAPVAERAGVAAGTVYRYFPGKIELIGALLEGLIGPVAPDGNDDPVRARDAVQAVTLLALRGLGVVDARARGLVVQTVLPETDVT